jgi:hypothetical protein
MCGVQRIGTPSFRAPRVGDREGTLKAPVIHRQTGITEPQAQRLQPGRGRQQQPPAVLDRQPVRVDQRRAAVRVDQLQALAAAKRGVGDDHDITPVLVPALATGANDRLRAGGLQVGGDRGERHPGQEGEPATSFGQRRGHQHRQVTLALIVGHR